MKPLSSMELLEARGQRMNNKNRKNKQIVGWVVASITVTLIAGNIIDSYTPPDENSAASTNPITSMMSTTTTSTTLPDWDDFIYCNGGWKEKKSGDCTTTTTTRRRTTPTPTSSWRTTTTRKRTNTRLRTKECSEYEAHLLDKWRYLDDSDAQEYATKGCAMLTAQIYCDSTLISVQDRYDCADKIYRNVDFSSTSKKNISRTLFHDMVGLHDNPLNCKPHNQGSMWYNNEEICRQNARYLNELARDTLEFATKR